jgi:hypothetical protein
MFSNSRIIDVHILISVTKHDFVADEPSLIDVTFTRDLKQLAIPSVVLHQIIVRTMFQNSL